MGPYEAHDAYAPQLVPLPVQMRWEPGRFLAARVESRNPWSVRWVARIPPPHVDGQRLEDVVATNLLLIQSRDREQHRGVVEFGNPPGLGDHEFGQGRVGFNVGQLCIGCLRHEAQGQRQG